MKAKYIIILILLLLLGLVVNSMLKLEQRIRRQRVVEVVLEDKNKPLVEDMPLEQLEALAQQSEYLFKADGDYLSVYSTTLSGSQEVQRWEEVFIKGVNMGVALPGKWPSEFAATHDEYLEWFILIGQMNANTIRTYTILPPEFYKALEYYNLHFAHRKIWLMQGVWADEPPNHNYGDPGYTRTFLTEIRDAIDVIHGNLVRPERHGHAAGVYSADVSKYTIGWALGREWEPEAVSGTNKNDSIDLPFGVFIDVLEGNGMERWLAGVMEFTARYETQKYQAQRPISFINWLTLDPMFHNRELGVDDLETVDMEKFSHTHLFKPGLFASYHVYPYYPDYIFLEEKYTNTINHLGDTDNFLAYLIDLKKHQAGMPLVIAEYGVPNSRGNSHYTPFGFSHGGYPEQEQADMTRLLTEDIHRSGCAGGLVFAWIDEWFKNNWLVQPMEEPQERRKNWHNAENPEQHYGIMAMESRVRWIDGKPDDWNTDLQRPFLKATSDASYFYLAANIPAIDFSKHNLYIAIDTHDKRRGSFKLPFRKEPLKRGVEFLVEIRDSSYASVLVDHHYTSFANIFLEEYPAYQSIANHDGKFIEQFMLSNPARVDVLGDTSAELKHDRGKLQFGRCTNPATSNAGIYWNRQGFLEMRISWPVLNVTDPSGRFVADGFDRKGVVKVSETDGFFLYFYVTDKKNRPVAVYPDEETLRYTWDRWEEPEFTSRIKPVYYSLQELFKTIKPLPQTQIYDIPNDHQFTLCPFYRGKPGAVTFAFDGRCYSQYTDAMAILKGYNLPATFSRSYYGTSSRGGTHYQQMLEDEFMALAQQGHEVRPEGSWILPGKLPGQELLATTPWKPSHPFIRIRSNRDPDLHRIDSLLKQGVNDWSILLMRHVYDPQSKAYSNLIHLAGKGVHNISSDHLDKIIRLGRNTGRWVATFEQVANYRFLFENSTITSSGYNNFYFVTVTNSLSTTMNRQPLTVKYQGPGKIIRVKGSATDGTFRVRAGNLYVDLWPNQEATLEILEN